MLQAEVSNIRAPHPAAVAAAPFAALRSPAARRKLYALIALLGFIGTTLVSVGRMLTFDTSFNIATGDGKDYYVYLASVLADHDLDFANQMIDHYGREFEPAALSNRTPRGYVADKYPIGLALTLSPAALIAHAICVPLYRLTGNEVFAPDGYSMLYQVFVLMWIQILGFFALSMIDALLSEHIGSDGRWIALGICCVALGSPWAFHFLTYPVAAHTISVFWVVASMLLSMRMIDDADDRRRLDVRRVAALSFCVAMALVTRPTNILVVPFLVLLACRIARNGLAGRAIAMLPIALVCCVPILVQTWVWHRMVGSWITFSYQGERFHFERPRLWQTLLSSRNGLFWWSPILILAAIGLIWRQASSRESRRNALVICSILSFGILWYFNSAWWAWWFGESWGGRAFVEVLPLFMIGMTWLIERMATMSADARRAWTGAIGGSLVWVLILVTLWYGKKIPRADYLIPTWRIRQVGPPPEI